GEPLARTSRAALPAVEPTSIALARSASFALLEPADWVQVTVTESPSVSSIQPCSLLMRLSVLYVATARLRVSALHSLSPDVPAVAPAAGASGVDDSPATQPLSIRVATAASAAADTGTDSALRILMGFLSWWVSRSGRSGRVGRVGSVG